MIAKPDGADESRRIQDLLEANNRYLGDARIARRAAAGGFQGRVDPWLLTCFGEAIARDRQERSHQFLEEALELVQASGSTASEAHQLVDYVFARPGGEMDQEIGGVMVTLAAFCLAHGHDMAEAGERELARIWTKIEKIRAKQAAKPKHSPLPESAPSAFPRGSDAPLAEFAGEITRAAMMFDAKNYWRDRAGQAEGRLALITEVLDAAARDAAARLAEDQPRPEDDDGA